MNKRIFVLMIVCLLFGSNLYAANGDLIVNNNIGVGTTPAYKLDVSGDVRFTGTLQGGSVPWARLSAFPAACTSGQYVSGIGLTLTCSTPSGGGGGLSGSGTANYVSKWTGGTSLGNSLIYDNGTNVGIGTTSPPASLSVGSGNPFQVNSGGLMSIATSWGGPLVYVREVGSGYGNSNAAIVADTDNANGSSNFSFQGRLVGANTFSVRSDGQGYFAGKLGIGTTAPTTKLQLTNGEFGIGRQSDASPPVRFGIDSYGAIYFTNNAGMVGSSMYYITSGPVSAVVQSKTDGDIYFLTGSSGTGPVTWSSKLYIKNSGNVGIGTTNPTYLLHLSADSAAKPSTATWSFYSDERLKKNIQPYTKGLKEILQINPVTYQYNGKGGIGHQKIMEKDVADEELLSKTNVGIIAQDIQDVVPETVSSHKGKINEDDAEETDLLDFNPHALIFILINAVKELESQIDSLNGQIADLKAQIK